MNKELLAEIKKLMLSAGEIALNARMSGIKVTWKPDNSPVTNADQEISQHIYDILSVLTPEIPIICEERDLFPINKKEKFWLIDPIDGTRSFISDKDSFTVNIALIENQEAVYGFIYQPATGKLYYTDENKKFCIEINGETTGQNPHSHNGFVAVVSSNDFNSLTSNYLKDHGLSKIISIPSSLKLCLIAEGVGDVFPKFGTTMEWDIAAGHALIKSAGGEIHLLDGKLMSYAKDGFLNPHFLAVNKNWISQL